LNQLSHTTKRWLIWLTWVGCLHGMAGVYVYTPVRESFFGPTDSATQLPFVAKYQGLQTMRYQQVYNASAFSNVPPECIYVTTLALLWDFSTPGSAVWTVPSMQINLSTTERSADNLSANLQENVGTNDTVVFGPAAHKFDGSAGANFPIFFDQPFRYSPGDGNLLLDVRIYDSGTIEPFTSTPILDAQDSATDTVSRVWTTNVTAITAAGSDTLGLYTILQFSPIPSLVIYTSTFGTPTNWFSIEWPNQPSVFKLQQSASLGSGANWVTLTNSVAPRYYFPVASGGPAAFYRLIWETGQPPPPPQLFQPLVVNQPH
jgi:hypothetical protein